MAKQKPTTAQEDEVLNLAYEGEDQGSRWPGMSYESGVIATIEWMRGDRSEHPFEEN